jgi:hypothetical protein
VKYGSEGGYRARLSHCGYLEAEYVLWYTLPWFARQSALRVLYHFLMGVMKGHHPSQEQRIHQSKAALVETTPVMIPLTIM